MDNTVKKLIIIVIILVSVLGVAVGFILQGSLTNTNEIVNQSYSAVNTTNQTTQQNPQSDEKFISASKAIEIANKLKAKYNMVATGDVDYINAPARGLPGNPYWKVYLKNKNPDGEPKSAYVFIDAVTGKEK